jgi:hypothetical protein
VDVFKVKPGMSRIYPVSRENYEAATGQGEKYRKEGRGGESYFAVCPACDNPIQMIGLYRNTAESGARRVECLWFNREAGERLTAEQVAAAAP